MSQDSTGSRSFDIETVIQKDAEEKRKKKREHKEITLKQYLDLVKEDPGIAQLAPSRLLGIYDAYGVESIPGHEALILGADVRYSMISKILFGTERTTHEFVQYLRSGDQRLSTGKQIALLVGPPASGKSTFVNRNKRVLENYTDKLVYQVKGCPMQEEPLHVLPRYMRRSHWDAEKAANVGLDSPIEDYLGISDIEGDLCPYCRRAIIEDYTDEDGVLKWWDVPVETFSFSIQAGRGIGSFEPSDQKSQDVAELVGRENIGITSNPKHGLNHRNAFWLNGELEKGNRGITEGREFLKKGIDEKILWVFINVAEEKEFKVQGSNFTHVYVDTVVIGHCNLEGYKAFAADKGQEALHNRIYVIPCPYPLRVQDEVAVYRKLIEKESNFNALRKSHISPGTLELAATFAALTRLVPSNLGVDNLTKLKAYNGEKILTELEDQEKNPIDLRTIIEEGQKNDDIAKREGMFGVSSRDVLAALNTALVEESGANGCLTQLKAIKALKEVFRHRMGYTPEQITGFMELLSAEEGGSVVTVYKEFLVEQVTRAYLRAYDDLVKESFEKYIEDVRLDRERKRKLVRGDASKLERDPITGKPKEPNEKFMRSIEEKIPIAQAESDVFRGEIMEYVSSNPDFSYKTYDPLRRAIEKKLVDDSRSNFILVLSTDKPRDAEDKKRAQDLFDTLKAEGFCEICARETIEKAAEVINE